MNRRRSLTRRKDRPGAPHSRIPDAVYYELLPFLHPIEVKLWFALKSREWRKNGTRKGTIRKSLRRIAKDINMPWTTAQRAFGGLRLKGLAEWTSSGIRLLETSFTTAFTTGFTTEGGPLWTRGGPPTDQKWSTGGPPSALIPFPAKGMDYGRSDLTIRHASSASLRAVESTTDSTTRTPRGKPRASARSSRALPPKRKEKTTSVNEDNEPKPLSKEEAKAALQKIFGAAETGTAALKAPKEEQQRRQAERLRTLRQQAAELEKEERCE